MPDDPPRSVSGRSSRPRGARRRSSDAIERQPAAVVVSACLLGAHCRYDGRSGGDPELHQRLGALAAVGLVLRAVCPEQLAGLGTPRPPATLHGGDGGDVLKGAASVRRNDDGVDVSAAFVRGAELARAALGPQKPVLGILKARSPSCGVGTTWRDGAVRDGDGVFAALLRREGVPLHDDEGFLATAAAGALAGRQAAGSDDD